MKDFRKEFLKYIDKLIPSVARAIEKHIVNFKVKNLFARGTIESKGDLTVVGNTSLSGTLLLTSTGPGTDPAPVATFTRISASPANNDQLGRIAFSGSNDAGEVLEYARITSEISDVSDGGEDGRIIFDVMKNGSMSSMLEIKNNECVFNNFNKDTDFRVETDDETHFIFVDANANRMSIGDNTGAPGATLEVKNNATAGAYNAPLVQLNSNDTDQIALDINASNIDANVVDILADSVTTANVVNASADALTTGGILNLVSDSSNTSARALATIHNDNTAAVGATGLYIKNDAVASTAKQTVLIETTVASEDNPLLRLKNSNADANGPILRFENSAGADGSDDDFVGTISFYGEDDGTPTDVEYAKIAAQATDVSSGAKNGTVAFTAMVANAAREVARMNPESSTAGTFCGGFGYRRPVIEVTDATYVLTADQSGVILALNRPAGITVTLPADTNTGFHCKMVALDTFSGTWKIATESDGDLLLGGITIISAAAKADQFGANGSSHDTMTMDSAAKGRAKGGSVEFTSVAANKWLVSGVLQGNSTPVSPFTNS